MIRLCAASLPLWLVIAWCRSCMAAHTRDHALAVGSIGRLSHLSAHAAESCGASRSSRVKGPNPNLCRVSQLRSSVSVVIADSMLHQPCSSLGHPGWPLGSGSDKHLIHFRVPRNTRFLEHSSCTRHHSLMHHHPMHRRAVQGYERLKHHLSSALWFIRTLFIRTQLVR